MADEKLTPFSFINEINTGKKDIMLDQNGQHSDLLENIYNPFVVNRTLSYFNDTVLHANEMNKCHHIDNRCQFDYLINTVRKRKRFSKWAKPEDSANVDVIKEYYNCSNEKARQFLSLLSDNQLTELKQKVSHGGFKNNKSKQRRPK